MINYGKGGDGQPLYPIWGQGFGKEDMGNESFLTVLVDEEGNEEEFLRLADIEVEGESYAILVSETDDLVHILRIEAEEEGEELLVVVEDDDEFDRVVDALKTLVENGDLDIDIDFDDEYDYDDYDEDCDDDDDCDDE